jgi:hypothetical protein
MLLLVRTLNDALAELAKRATVKRLTAEDERRLRMATDALERLADVYLSSPAHERRAIRATSGVHPDVEESLIDELRRRMTWWPPRRKGDYIDALWVTAVILLAARAVAAARESGSVQPLRLALAALCIEGGRYDPRETSHSLVQLRREAAASGYDPRPLFEEAARRASEGCDAATDEKPPMAVLIERALD